MSNSNVELSCFLETKRQEIENLKTSVNSIRNEVVKHINELDILKDLFDKFLHTALNFNTWTEQIHESLVCETISMFQDHFITQLVNMSDTYVNDMQHEYKSLMLYNVQLDHKIKLKQLVDDVQSQIIDNFNEMFQLGKDFQSLFFDFEGNVRNTISQLEEFEKKKSKLLMEIKTAINQEQSFKCNKEYLAVMKTFDTLNKLCVIRHKVASKFKYLLVHGLDYYNDDYKAAHQILKSVDFDLMKSIQNSKFQLDEDTSSGGMNTLCLNLDMMEIVNEIKEHFFDFTIVEMQIELELQNIMNWKNSNE